MDKEIILSLTSIFQNQHILLKTITSLLKQTITNFKIYIWLSSDPYLIDTGFTNKIITNNNLLTLINDNNNIEIKWCENIGPYRKLLPVLKENWVNDCLIITLDDDIVYHPKLIENLINDYNEYNCCINYRGYTMDFNSIKDIEYRKKKQLIPKYLYNFSTNGAGTIWHPSFFHNTKDLIFNEKLYMKLCPTADDIWYNFCRIANQVECYLNIDKEERPYVLKWNTQNWALYKKYNWVNNRNTKYIKNVINKFLELNILKDKENKKDN